MDEHLQKKSGPKTLSGKKIISRNALKHGLSAQSQEQKWIDTQTHKLADILVGTNKTPYVYELAIKAADAQYQILFIRKKMMEELNKIRTKYIPVHIARKNIKNFIKYIEVNVPDIYMQVDLELDYVDEQTSPQILSEDEALIEALKDIHRLERYLRSALNKRKIAMRELSEFKK